MTLLDTVKLHCNVTLQNYSTKLYVLGSQVNSVAEKLVVGATHRAAIISLPIRIAHGYYSDSLATTNIPCVISKSTMMSLICEMK